jgi:hypothetical protein
MRLRNGYTYECPQITSMLLLLRVHTSRENNLLAPDSIVTEPSFPVQSYIDGFGNLCNRLTATGGKATRADLLGNIGLPEDIPYNAIDRGSGLGHTGCVRFLAPCFNAPDSQILECRLPQVEPLDSTLDLRQRRNELVATIAFGH